MRAVLAHIQCELKQADDARNCVAMLGDQFLHSLRALSSSAVLAYSQCELKHIYEDSLPAVLAYSECELKQADVVRSAQPRKATNSSHALSSQLSWLLGPGPPPF